MPTSQTTRQTTSKASDKIVCRFSSFQSLIDTYGLNKTWKNHPELLRDCEKIFNSYRKQPKPFNVLMLELSDSLEMPAHLGACWTGDRLAWGRSMISIEHLGHYYEWTYGMAQYTYRK